GGAESGAVPRQHLGATTGQEKAMSDQFQRQSRQWQQQEQAAQQSAARMRQWQQDIFKRQREAQAHLAAQARGTENSSGAVAGGGRPGSLVRVLVVFMLLCALAVGAFLLIRSGQLSAWLD